MLEEMQIVTGGGDASQQTSGMGINMVTRSGTDRLKGSARYYITDDQFESDNVTEEMKKARAGSGAPIQSIKDYGFEIGGPILKGKLWYWGSYGKQDIKAGIVGFYLPTAECLGQGRGRLKSHVVETRCRESVVEMRMVIRGDRECVGEAKARGAGNQRHHVSKRAKVPHGKHATRWPIQALECQRDRTSQIAGADFLGSDSKKKHPILTRLRKDPEIRTGARAREIPFHTRRTGAFRGRDNWQQSTPRRRFTDRLPSCIEHIASNTF